MFVFFLVKGDQDHVSNRTSVDSDTWVRGCHCYLPCLNPATDMTWRAELLNTSMHGNVVYHVTQIKCRVEIQTTVWKKCVSSTGCICECFCVCLAFKSLSNKVFRILCSHQFCPALLFYWCVAFWEAGNWLVFRASSLPQCVWSMQRPGHPPGQSRGKGVCQKHCPQQAELSLGKALWSTTPPLPPMPETIPDYWYLWNAQSSLLFHSSFHTRFLMLLWLTFWATSIGI